jgi:hypothetical protein
MAARQIISSVGIANTPAPTSHPITLPTGSGGGILGCYAINVARAVPCSDTTNVVVLTSASSPAAVINEMVMGLIATRNLLLVLHSGTFVHNVSKRGQAAQPLPLGSSCYSWCRKLTLDEWSAH